MAVIQSALPDTSDRPVCMRCDGSGARRVWHMSAWRTVDGRCPDCNGSGHGPKGSSPQLSKTEAQQVLRDLRDLGMDLAEWRYNKTADAPGHRAETRHKIRQVVERGITTFTYEEMAKELGVSRQQLDNIRKERPTGRGNRGEVAEAVLLERETYKELVQLGASYTLWGHTDTPERDNVRAAIRAAVDRARDQGVSRKEAAELLGISPEQLRTILRKAAEKANSGAD